LDLVPKLQSRAVSPHPEVNEQTEEIIRLKQRANELAVDNEDLFDANKALREELEKLRSELQKSRLQRQQMVEDTFAQGLADELAALKKSEERTRKAMVKLITETLCKDFDLQSLDNKQLLQIID